ncbi:MAG: hypothetical protein SFU87_15830 [Chitinophagaceae bacterium]|nr:hypothetical protein [Chitinophagaceae bacterium]
MQKLMLPVILFCLLLSCKNKKPSLSGEDPVEVTDFIASFPEVTLPFSISDTLLRRKLKDSMLISAKVFTQFVKDTVYSKDFGKTVKPKLYVLGRVTEKKKLTYLFVKAATPAKQVAYVLCFDEQNQFKTAMPFAYAAERSASYEGAMDRRYTISTNKTRRGGDGQLYYRKNAYVYNTAGVFTLILTESNETVETREIYNPIDTLSRKNKWSGNYIKDRRNFISVRDGRKPNVYLFFVHFEKNNGECTGELRGEVQLVKPGIAHYRETGDPCELEFSFTAAAVSIKEMRGCGNHRGIKCFFEGNYPKKKEPKKPAAKPRTKK